MYHHCIPIHSVEFTEDEFELLKLIWDAISSHKCITLYPSTINRFFTVENGLESVRNFYNAPKIQTYITTHEDIKIMDRWIDIPIYQLDLNRFRNLLHIHNSEKTRQTTKILWNILTLYEQLQKYAMYINIDKYEITYVLRRVCKV